MNSRLMSVDDVAEFFGVSKSYAYKLVRELNAELQKKGYITVAGRIRTKYLFDRMGKRTDV